MTYKMNSQVSGENKSCWEETDSAASRGEKVKQILTQSRRGKTYLLQLEQDLALEGCVQTDQTEMGLQPTA